MPYQLQIDAAGDLLEICRELMALERAMTSHECARDRKRTAY